MLILPEGIDPYQFHRVQLDHPRCCRVAAINRSAALNHSAALAGPGSQRQVQPLMNNE